MVKAYLVEAQVTDTMAVRVWAASPEEAREKGMEALRDAEGTFRHLIKPGSIQPTRVAEAR